MEVKDIVVALHRGKGFSEAEASKQAYTMFAAVRSKHPRLNITGLVFEGEKTIVVLQNKTRVIFAPSLPVPIWKYPESARTTNPKTADRRYLNVLGRLIGLEIRSLSPERSDDEKREATEEIDKILKQRGATSVKSLEERLLQANEAEWGLLD